MIIYQVKSQTVGHQELRFYWNRLYVNKINLFIYLHYIYFFFMKVNEVCAALWPAQHWKSFILTLPPVLKLCDLKTEYLDWFSDSLYRTALLIYAWVTGYFGHSPNFQTGHQCLKCKRSLQSPRISLPSRQLSGVCLNITFMFQACCLIKH